MKHLLLIINFVGIFIGIVLAIAGYVTSAKEIESWGLQPYTLYGIGFIILIVSVAFLVFTLNKENQMLKKSLSDTQAQNQLLNDAKRQHFSDLIALIQDWKDNLVLDTNEPVIGRGYDTQFATDFDQSDWKLNTHFQKGVRWYINAKGDVFVRFPVEDNILFKCLEDHVDKRVWKLYRQLKHEISITIKQIPRLQKGHVIDNSNIYSLAYQLADELGIILARHGYFPNKCKACPEF